MAYSVTDSRVTPNTPVATNGTEIYTGQTSSNHEIPPTDSRAAGAPVKSDSLPQNSRTAGG